MSGAYYSPNPTTIHVHPSNEINKLTDKSLCLLTQGEGGTDESCDPCEDQGGTMALKSVLFNNGKSKHLVRVCNFTIPLVKCHSHQNNVYTRMDICVCVRQCACVRVHACVCVCVHGIYGGTRLDSVLTFTEGSPQQCLHIQT